MDSSSGRIWRLGVVLAVFYLGVRYVLPLLLPFLMGLLLALAAEPMVRFFSRKCRLRRTWASGLGMGLTLCLLALAVLTLCGLLIRELSALTGILPELEEGVRSGMGALSGWALGLVNRAPEGIRGLLSRSVTEFFSGGSALLDRITDFLLRLASGILSRVPGGALSVFTAVISGFMISAKLPAIRDALRSRVPMEKLRLALRALKDVKSALVGWLKAQLRLSGVTFLITFLGLLLLRIPRAFLWAALVSLVDALPVLGSGAILVPWSIVCFLQGDPVRAFVLLGIYGAAAVTRSVLEPRLVGRQLGLDPLVTLMSLYIGYKLFGLAGMLLAPMLAVAATRLAAPRLWEDGGT